MLDVGSGNAFSGLSSENDWGLLAGCWTSSRFRQKYSLKRRKQRSIIIAPASSSGFPMYSHVVYIADTHAHTHQGLGSVGKVLG